MCEGEPSAHAPTERGRGVYFTESSDHSRSMIGKKTAPVCSVADSVYRVKALEFTDSALREPIGCHGRFITRDYRLRYLSAGDVRVGPDGTVTSRIRMRIVRSSQCQR